MAKLCLFFFVAYVQAVNGADEDISRLEAEIDTGRI